MFDTHRGSCVGLIVHCQHLPLLVRPQPPERLLLEVGEVHVRPSSFMYNIVISQSKTDQL